MSKYQIYEKLKQKKIRNSARIITKNLLYYDAKILYLDQTNNLLDICKLEDNKFITLNIDDILDIKNIPHKSTLILKKNKYTHEKINKIPNQNQIRTYLLISAYIKKCSQNSKLKHLSNIINIERCISNYYYGFF